MSMSPSKGEPDEDWYDLQIEQELENIDLEDGQGEDNSVEEEDHNQEEATNSEALECYLERIQKQSHQLELELEGVDELLHHKPTDISKDCVALVPTSEVDILQEAAAERGLDPEEYRKQILLELDNEEEDGFSLEEEELISNHSDQGGAGDDGQMVSVLITEMTPEVTEPILSSEEGDSSDQGENYLNSDSGAVVLANPTWQFREFLKDQWAVTTEKQKRRKALEREKTELARIQSEKIESELENRRHQNMKEFQDETKKLAKLTSTKTADLERELDENKKCTESEWKKIEQSIEDLERQTQKETEELIHQKAQESEKQERQREKSALKLQSVYRGYRVRKVHGPTLKEKTTERRKLMEIKKIEEKEVELKELDNQKKEREARKRQEEEKIKAEELEVENKQKAELNKLEEEKKRKEAEEERQKAEEERLLKEEQEKLLKEAKERKQREEEEQRKKAEEVEQKRIAEEKRKALEAEKQRKAEEAEKQRKNEEAEKQRNIEEAEKQRKIEEEKAALDAVKKKVEEDQLKAVMQTEAKKKLDEEKTASETEKKNLLEEKLSTENGTDSLDKCGEDTGMSSVSSQLLTASLPEDLEEKRRQWMSTCSPWSKLSTEPWKKKCSEKRKSAKRPSSAKKLPPLDSKVLLVAAQSSSLQEVSTVKLCDLPGSSLSTLSQCINLRHLDMTNCGLKAVDGLTACQSLQYINLQNNELQYVDLNDLENLEYVNLSSNQLSVLHGLERCPNLRWLDMSHNKLIKIGWLCGLRQLHTLNLSNNQLMSTRGLGEAPTLQHLNLANNHIQTVEDIDKLCLLQTLILTGNTILQIPSLSNQVLLQELYLDDNSITSLDTLLSSWLPCLRKLHLSQNSLSDVAELSYCMVLRDLDVSNNQLLDGEELAGNLKQCYHLHSVKVEGNPGAEEFRCAAVHLSSLLTVDSQLLERSEPLTMGNSRCSFEAMCLAHCERVEELSHTLQQSIRVEAEKSIHLESIHKAYSHYCRTSFDLAVESRYAHEYGEVTVNWPSAPAGPKPTVRPCSGRLRGRITDKQTTVAAKEDYCEKKHSKETDFDQEIKKLKSENKGDNPEMNTFNEEITLGVESVENNVEITNKSFKTCAKDNYRGALDEVSRMSETKGRPYLTTDSQKKQTFVKTEVISNGANSEIGISKSFLSSNSSLQPQYGSTANLKSEWTLLDDAATIIQATWRGYSLRSRLLQALEYARFSDEEEDEEEFQEIDLGDFNFDMADLDDDWKPPPTPKIPSSHAVLGKPPSGRPGSETGVHHPPVFPRQAWRNLTSPLTQRASPTGHLPRPPSSTLSGTDTHRTGLSKKEEMLSEEWGFKDTRTAELMFMRAKKMKYNSDKRKKLNKLDPKQKLALFKRLSESTRLIKPVQPLTRKALPRKEYFQARAREVEEKEREQRTEVAAKASRTFEWLHTQVGEFCSSGMSNVLPRNESESSLPRLDDDITAGRRVQLVGSPVPLEVESVTSAEDSARHRRLSLDDSATSLGVKSVPLQLPPIKTNSAPTSKVRERMSFRTPQKNADVGWGGGRKRQPYF